MTAIRCEGISKRYRLGERESYKALRDVLTDAARSPFRHLRTALTNNSHLRNPKSEIPNSFWALDDVSFEINRGEVVGVIGRNGAGKSTLLKILSRITRPTRGHAEIRGRVGSLLEVGTGFHPELSGRENIYLNAAILGMRKAEIERRFDEIVAFAEIERFIDTPVKRYSSGMYVRLAFAVAAHMDTEVLLIDEVLSVGDSEFQKKCLGRMDEVARGGRTVLFVSHDMTAIKILCQKALHLDRGRLIGIGSPEGQIASYLDLKKERGLKADHQEVVLGSTIRIHSFEFSPNPVFSGQAVEFNIALSASKAVRLDEIAILVYSTFGRRVAILDLRRLNRVYRLGDLDVEEISGRIENLPLVQGEYEVGLYLNWGHKKGDFYDLLQLKVEGSPARGGMVPYEASVRGVVELNYELH
jgi:lipopolysaccharide transport system ATP-binding protein